MSAVFAKCERFKRTIDERAKPEVVTTVNYQGSSFETDIEQAKVCDIDIKDSTLEDALLKSGHNAWMYSAISSVKIEKDEIRADVVVNTASCKKDVRSSIPFSGLNQIHEELHMQQLLEQDCTIDEVHFHAGHDNATHIHIRCPRSSMDALDELAKTILDGFDIGRRHCRTTPPLSEHFHGGG